MTAYTRTVRSVRGELREEANVRRVATHGVGYSTDEARRLRIEVLTHYGGDPVVCACCGEDNLEFMTIDHINGGGNRHRKRLGNNMLVYRELRRLGYPAGYRVLCMNCNHSLGHYGYCPHGGLDEATGDRSVRRGA